MKPPGKGGGVAGASSACCLHSCSSGHLQHRETFADHSLLSVLEERLLGAFQVVCVSPR